MDADKKARLEAAGFKVGTPAEFLDDISKQKPQKFPYTDADLERIKRDSAEQEAYEPYAESLRYDPDTGFLHIGLRSGANLVYVARSLRGLANATDEQLARGHIRGGRALFFDDLNVQISLLALITDLESVVTATNHWNYRVVKRSTDNKGKPLAEPFVGIYEAHYKSGEEKPYSISKEPTEVQAETVDELAQVLNGMREALSKPVLNWEEF
jgi:hypothetical protein